MMMRRSVFLAVLVVAFSSAGQSAQKGRKPLQISEEIFRKTSSLLLEDPLHKSTRDRSRLILLYAQDTKDAVVVMGRDEWRWAGLDERNPYSLQLLAAYKAGNILSQLNSGVKRNDRYSGLLALFRVYRVLKEQNQKGKVTAVEKLLALHQDGNLVSHLQELDEKKPTKLTPLEELLIRELMRTR